MRVTISFSAIGFAVLVLVATHAEAFPPSAQDSRRFTETILQATKELNFSKRPDIAQARRLCTEARDLARRFDPNDYWSALVEDCFAAVGEFDKDSLTACGHYKAAADRYAKVRNDPKARSVEGDLARIAQAQSRLGCVAPAIVAPLEMGDHGALSEGALKEIMTRTTGAATLLTRKNAAGAREACEEARFIASRYSANGFASGLVEECFGEVELFEKNQGVACTRYELALAHYGSAKRNEPGAAQTDAQMRKLRRIRDKLNC